MGWGRECGPKSLGRGKRTSGHLEGLLRHILDKRWSCCHEFMWDCVSGLSTAALFINGHVSLESLAVGLVHNSFMSYIASLLPSLSVSLLNPPCTVLPVAWNVPGLALYGALPKHQSWPVAAPVSFLSICLGCLTYFYSYSLVLGCGTPCLWHYIQRGGVEILNENIAGWCLCGETSLYLILQAYLLGNSWGGCPYPGQPALWQKSLFIHINRRLGKKGQLSRCSSTSVGTAGKPEGFQACLEVFLVLWRVLLSAEPNCYLLQFKAFNCWGL